MVSNYSYYTQQRFSWPEGRGAEGGGRQGEEDGEGRRRLECTVAEKKSIQAGADSECCSVTGF